MKIFFTVDGEPVAKARPKFVIAKGFPIAYTPEKTRIAEKTIRDTAVMFYRCVPTTKPVEVNLVFHKSVPKSWSKKKQQEALDGLILPQMKPDIDNYIKTVFDALNGVVWVDDSQVCSVNAKKKYSEKAGIDVGIFY
jgi:Holliday junction resolvase RusA-like endonuclease